MTLGRLGRDFAAIDARLTENVSRWQVKTSAALDVLADVEAYKAQGRWPRAKADTLAAVSGVFDGRIPAPRAATYIELLSAGRLGLIRDPRLRDALLAYDMQVGFAQTAYEVLVQRVQPYMGPLVGHLRLDRAVAADNAAPIPALMNRSVWSDIDLQGLAADPRLTEAFNMYASASRNQLVVARLQQEKARDVLALLPPAAPRRVDASAPAPAAR